MDDRRRAPRVGPAGAVRERRGKPSSRGRPGSAVGAVPDGTADRVHRRRRRRHRDVPRIAGSEHPARRLRSRPGRRRLRLRRHGDGLLRGSTDGAGRSRVRRALPAHVRGHPARSRSRWSSCSARSIGGTTLSSHPQLIEQEPGLWASESLPEVSVSSASPTRFDFGPSSRGVDLARRRSRSWRCSSVLGLGYARAAFDDAVVVDRDRAGVRRRRASRSRRSCSTGSGYAWSRPRSRSPPRPWGASAASRSSSSCSGSGIDARRRRSRSEPHEQADHDRREHVVPDQDVQVVRVGEPERLRRPLREREDRRQRDQADARHPREDPDQRERPREVPREEHRAEQRQGEQRPSPSAEELEGRPPRRRPARDRPDEPDHRGHERDRERDARDHTQSCPR